VIGLQQAPWARRTWYWTFYVYCGLVLVFLLVPILVIIPLSFNADPFLTYPLTGFSLRWYADFFSSQRWLNALKNSLLVACATTVIATPLGTLAALGLARPNVPFKQAIMAMLISPLIVPVIVTAVGMYFLYAPRGLTNNYLGLILSHTVLAAPFVVVVVHATLDGFDSRLVRAGLSLGASPTTVFFKIVFPLIWPGIVAGAVFAFTTSFDEVVTAIFLAGPMQRTLPLQMFEGIREEISPTITAAATLFITVTVLLLVTIELLRRRTRKVFGAPR